jgi:hypothetical protein
MHDITMLDIFALLCILGVILTLLFGGKVRYTYFSTSDRWRSCAACGQEQVMVCEQKLIPVCHWQVVGDVKNQKCNCHNDATP